jgi:A/G-specific adenine glycosylase
MDSKRMNNFSARLLRWHSTVERPMPWKNEQNPYKVWLSEVILQQTRVEQGWNYYKSFLKKFPTIKHLANAPEQDVLQQWEGLGYYSRARNLHHTAKFIAETHNGKLPSTYNEIIALKGIGPYTAAAIASFAFGLPHAVVDGNVFRILSRYFGIKTPTDSSQGKKIFFDLANKLIPKNKPAKFNQAMMDFGALVCRPNPLCDSCPFSKDCFAKQNDLIRSLPVRSKKAKVRKRYFHYYIFIYKNKILIQQRNENDIWNGLHQFPMEEMKSESWKKNDSKFKNILSDKKIKPIILTQLLTHQLIHGSFYFISVKKIFTAKEEFHWVEKSELEKFPMPKIMREYVKKYLS